MPAILPYYQPYVFIRRFHMPLSVFRKIIRFGKEGLVINIPIAWARYHNLQPGDSLEVIANNKLVIRPTKNK